MTELEFNGVTSLGTPLTPYTGSIDLDRVPNVGENSKPGSKTEDDVVDVTCNKTTDTDNEFDAR